jgi:hypothetical protein
MRWFKEEVEIILGVIMTANWWIVGCPDERRGEEK